MHQKHQAMNYCSILVFSTIYELISKTFIRTDSIWLRLWNCMRNTSNFSTLHWILNVICLQSRQRARMKRRSHEQKIWVIACNDNIHLSSMLDKHWLWFLLHTVILMAFYHLSTNMMVAVCFSFSFSLCFIY